MANTGRVNRKLARIDRRRKGNQFQREPESAAFRRADKPFESTYDVAPDGRRFVMSASPEEEEPPLVLMLSWTAGLQAK